MKQENYTIEGMTCASCSSAVERVTRKMEGVQESNVNLMTNRLTIRYDEELVTPDDIIQKVERAGFGASLEVMEEESDHQQVEQDSAILESKRKQRRLLISILFSIPLLYISMGHMVPWPMPLPKFLDMMESPMNFALAQLVLTLIIMINGRRFYSSGFKTLFLGHPNMDSLVAIGTGSAFLYSLYMTIQITKDHMAVHHLYYESAAIVITLIMLGKYLESRSKGKTSEAIRKLMELAPQEAWLVEGEQERRISLKEVEKGMVLRVKPGEKIPLDGIVVRGETSVNESMLTGESIPVEKSNGSNVIGGSINYNGSIEIKVTHVGADTTLAKIIKLMEEAQGRKAPISKLADKVAGYFVPIVMGIAILAAIVWLLLGFELSFVLNIFVSILVIACPCALGLATPTAIMVGTGVGANHGILIKSGEALETTHKVNTVVLDKTGTITSGKPKVVEISSQLEENEILQIAASCEVESEHPLGEAIVEAGRERGIQLQRVDGFKSITGKGIEAIYEGQKVRIGNKRLMDEYEFSIGAYEEKAREVAGKGQTPMFVVIEEQLVGIISVADTIKESSKEAISKLQKLGLKVYMLTGDNELTANYIGKQVGVDKVISQVLPQDKSNIVKELQSQGNVVLMAGDGINDAPALAQADIGIAIGEGSDIAMESSDIVLMKSDLRDIYKAIKLSKLTIRNIKENLFWAFFYNCIGIPVAAGVLYGINGTLLSPMIAGFAMSLSSVSVVGNALRLRKMKI